MNFAATFISSVCETQFTEKLNEFSPFNLSPFFLVPEIHFHRKRVPLCSWQLHPSIDRSRSLNRAFVPVGLSQLPFAEISTPKSGKIHPALITYAFIKRERNIMQKRKRRVKTTSISTVRYGNNFHLFDGGWKENPHTHTRIFVPKPTYHQLGWD